MGPEAVVEAARIRRQDIAFFVGQHLLDGVRLLDVRDVPVPDPFPGRVGVAAENKLTARRVDLQQLRPVGMAPECGMNNQPRGDLEPPVDDLGLPGEDLALDFRKCLAADSRRPGCARRPAPAAPPGLR